MSSNTLSRWARTGFAPALGVAWLLGQAGCGGPEQKTGQQVQAVNPEAAKIQQEMTDFMKKNPAGAPAASGSQNDMNSFMKKGRR